MNDEDLLYFYNSDNLKPIISKKRTTLYAKLINLTKSLGVKF